MNYQQFETWLQKLGQAWKQGDANAAALLCTDNVIYYENPLDKPLLGRNAVYNEWLNVPKSQKNINFSCDILHIEKHIGIAHWSASYTSIRTKKQVKLDGIFIISLNNMGLCTEFRQWWISS